MPTEETAGRALSGALAVQRGVDRVCPQLHDLVLYEVARRESERGSDEHFAAATAVGRTAIQVIRAAETYFEIDQIYRLLKAFPSLRQEAKRVRARFGRERYPSFPNPRTLHYPFVYSDGAIVFPIKSKGERPRIVPFPS